MLIQPSITRSIYRACLSSFRPTHFQGIHAPKAKALFVFDLDGTFAEGTESEIQAILRFQQQKNGILVYATGRTLKEFYKLQAKLKETGGYLPLPQYLITNNGQFLYEQRDGVLIEDKAWERYLQEKTNFNRSIVYDTMKALAHRKEYLLNHKKYEHQVDVKLLQAQDPDFWKSKISYYQWNPSKFMVEFFVSPDIEIEALKAQISEHLNQKGITTKFILNRYPKPIMDACSSDIRLQTQPIRQDQHGTVTALFLCPADKADGVEYIRAKNNIAAPEVILAGNDTNDVSLAHFVQQGAYFIGVGNAHQILLDCIKKLKAQWSNNVIVAKQTGAAGILEGLNEIMASLQHTSTKK